MAMSLNSPAFKQNGHIPSKYTCEGEDVSLPLAWEGAPDGAKSLVLIIDDPDAPDPKAPKMAWVHWVVYNMPPDTKSLPENAAKAGLPQGALLGLNDFKKAGYGGPCPPIGRHRYFHKLYALDITLDLRDATKSQIEGAMQGHVLANAELIGTLRQPCLVSVLRQALGIGRYVIDGPMYPNHFRGFRIGCVRIVDNQDKTFRALGDTLPRKWRRDIFALAGVLRGNVTILLERG